MPTPRIPSYCHHRASGQAYVTLRSRDGRKRVVYLGEHDSPESHQRYNAVIAEYLAGAKRVAPGRPGIIDLGPTIGEVMESFLTWVDSYYRDPDGNPTVEAALIRLSLRQLKTLFIHEPVRELTPSKLKAARQAMVDAGISRPEINRRIGRIVRMVRWGVENELVSVDVLSALRCIMPLKRGRCEAKEPTPKGPVPDAWVDAVRPFVSPTIWAMIEVLRLTGARPGEICRMRTVDLNASGSTWVYTPAWHKTSYRDRDRKVYVGPRAVEILRPWLKTDLEAPIFSPRESMASHRAELRANRRTPVQPSQRDRRKVKPKCLPGRFYTPGRICQAVARACVKAGVPHWTPYQLRKACATKVRRELTLEHAKAVLGHSDMAVTAEFYAARDESLGQEAMAKLG